MRAKARKKQKSMKELKLYTGNDAKKSKRESDKFKGWSEEARKFMVKLTKGIKENVESGAHREWEKVYKKICTVVKQSDEQEEESVGDAEVDYSVLYCEV